MSGGIAAVQGQKRRSRDPVPFTGRRGRLMIDMPDRVGGPERDAPGPSAGRLGVAMSTQRCKPHEMRSNFATRERDMAGATVDVNVVPLRNTAAKRLSVLADSQFTRTTPGTGPSSPPYHEPDGGTPRTDDSEPAAPPEPGLAFLQGACAVGREDVGLAWSIRSGILR